MLRTLSLSALALAFTTTIGCGSSYSPSSGGAAGAADDPAGDSSGSAPGAPSSGKPSQGAPSGSASSSPPSASGPQTTDLHYSVKGDPSHQAVVFIHGGPGANSMMFEATAQEALANEGYYVVAYDQRGSTRSPQGTAADYSYARSTKDLDDLIGALHLSSPVLLAHSFGGSIALHYLDAYAGRAKGAILVSSPISFPQTYETSLEQCSLRDKQQGKMSSAKDADALRQRMFPNGVTGPFTYSVTDIEAVMQDTADAMLYYPMPPTTDDVQLALSIGPQGSSMMSDVNSAVGEGYQANDQVGYQDLTALLKAHRSEVRGIYAPSYDVMFDRTQLAAIEANVASYDTVDDAGHFIFVDQTAAFVDAVAKDLAAMK